MSNISALQPTGSKLHVLKFHTITTLGTIAWRYLAQVWLKPRLLPMAWHIVPSQVWNMPTTTPPKTAAKVHTP